MALGLREIDQGREDLAGFMVSDMVRGETSHMLSMVEGEALRLALAYERENGRDLVGQGANRAASRMLDNAFGADEGAYELASHLVADLALQRHAVTVLEAGRAFREEGKEPEGFDRALVEYVIKQDLGSDPEVAADWQAVAEGRFHDASRLMDDIIRDDVTQEAHVKGAGEWMYANQRGVDEIMGLGEPESRMERMTADMDEAYARDMREGNRIMAEESLGSSLAEHLAGEPGHSFLSADEQDRASGDWLREQRASIPTDEYKPFAPEQPEWRTRAEFEVGEAMQAYRLNDPTVMVDPSIDMAMRYLIKEGIDANGLHQRLEDAYVRTMQPHADIPSPHDLARQMVFDVATQVEAEGIRGEQRFLAGRTAQGKVAEGIVERMGIRTLHQEKPTDADLAMIGLGDFARVSEFHRAGLVLGLSYAREAGDRGKEMDARMDALYREGRTGWTMPEAAAKKVPEAKPKGGLAAQAARVSAEIGKGEPARTKGPQSLGDAMAAAFAAREAKVAGR